MKSIGFVTGLKKTFIITKQKQNTQLTLKKEKQWKRDRLKHHSDYNHKTLCKSPKLSELRYHL